MAYVCRCHFETKRESGRANGQILEGYRNTPSRQLALHPANHPRNLQRDRIDGNIRAKPLDELETPLLSGFVLCAVSAVHQLSHGDHRNAQVHHAECGFNLLQNL